MLLELLADFFNRGLENFVFRIARQIGTNGAGEGPARPASPFALFLAWRSKTIGIVLEVHAGISEKGVGRRSLKNINESGIGKGPFLQDCFRTRKLSPPCPVEAKNRSRGKRLSPEDLSVLQAGEVERFPPVLFAEPIQGPPIHGFVDLWKVGYVGRHFCDY